jgi:hypothetical protein
MTFCFTDMADSKSQMQSASFMISLRTKAMKVTYGDPGGMIGDTATYAPCSDEAKYVALI